MPYRLKVAENSVLGRDKYKSLKGKTECVAFVQQAAGAPPTPQWKQGIQVVGAKPGSIPRGTVIATFDAQGKYPADALGKHAAIYLSQNAQGIQVLDQWDAQGEVKPRTIHLHPPKGASRSNDANTFYVVE